MNINSNRNTLLSGALVVAGALSLHSMTVLDATPSTVYMTNRADHVSHVDVSIPETDFTPYDRLCIDVVNYGPSADEVDIHVGTNGVVFKFETNAYDYHYDFWSHLRRRHWAEVGKSCWTVDLGHWPGGKNARDKVAVMKFFSVQSFGSTIRLERFRLLKPGEEDVPALYSEVEEARIAAVVRNAADSESAKRAAKMAKLASDCSKAGLPTNEMLVCTATGMDQVRPFGTEGFSRLRPANELSLRLAQDEYESLQIVVTPSGSKKLGGVWVSLSDLVLQDGKGVLSATNVTCEVTGYVKSHGVAGYAVGRKAAPGAKSMRKAVNPFPGWWSYPILSYLHRTDVDPGTLQSFWVRVKCPLGQKAGVYRGMLTVTADNAKPIRLPVRVRVNGFAVPRSTPLPLAVSFNPWRIADPGLAETTKDVEDIKRYKNDPEGPCKIWRKHRVEWSDFLSDYYITMDNLYCSMNNPKRNFDMLVRQKSRGRNGIINLAFWGGTSDKPKDVKSWNEKVIPTLRKRYEEAKEFGVEDCVYLYGSDETPLAKCGPTGYAAKKLKEAFPNIPLMTTARDPDYGVGSILSYVDIFVPLTARYNLEKAARARAAGHQVWWYIADSPSGESANVELEFEPLDARSLMGAQTAKFRPDGFLMAELARWDSPRPLSGGPFFPEWTTRTFLASFNCCCTLTACGPDGIPISTLQLENFRDGLEDLAYVKLLEEKMKSAKSDDWKRRAGELVAVPDWVCKKCNDFSTDPAVIYAWRDAIADAIESAP